MVGNSLYGVTSAGGYHDNGTIFQLSLPTVPATAFSRSANFLVVNWPTNGSDCVLESSADLWTWTPVSNAPFIINGSYAVTNSLTDARRFFRLSR